MDRRTRSSSGCSCLMRLMFGARPENGEARSFSNTRSCIAEIQVACRSVEESFGWARAWLDFVSGLSDTKVVVFAHHRRVLDSAEVELRCIQKKMSRRWHARFSLGQSATSSARQGRNEESHSFSEATQAGQGNGAAEQGARLAFEFVRIDGSSTEDEKLRRRETFARNPNCRVALLSVTASSHGVSLTAR